MANIISNNNTNNNSSAIVYSHSHSGSRSNNNSGNSRLLLTEGNGDESTTTANSLRDVCNFLHSNSMAIQQMGASPYDHIIEMMRGLDLQDDGIVMNHKIKSIETDFCNIIRDENMLCESMEYINEQALSDGDTALKFALLFSSRNFDALAMKETKVRSAMLKILENNYNNAETYRFHDKNRLYNSITLLGEYYHRVRLADNSPIKILGTSLLKLLLDEISESEPINNKLAKLILSQITLNGDKMRVHHKTELTKLLYHIRRNLIEQPALKSATKALLLMTLDLYYSNFANLGSQLEEMYTRFLVQEHEDEGNNNTNMNNSATNSYQQHQPSVADTSPISSQSSEHQDYQRSPLRPEEAAQQQSPEPANNYPPSTSFDDMRNNSHDHASAAHQSHELSEPESPQSAPTTTSTTKTWSQQVCEDSMLENEYATEEDSPNSTTNDFGAPDIENNSPGSQNNSRRSYQPSRSPRPLKNHNEDQEPNIRPPPRNAYSNADYEESDETKPLPRWRTPRFNRDNADPQQNQQQQQHHHQGGGRNRQPQRRFSASYEDDRHSVRSEGGSIRLYSISDRLKHAQEKIERSNTNQYNNIANSNWDRQSQRDDRSERSYISNYERGNHNHRRGHGNNRHYNNRHNYDKPPRFQKFQNQQKQQHQQRDRDRDRDQQYHGSNKDDKIHSDSWRRSNHFNEGPHEADANSRSNSRARTLPRPAKSHIDGAPVYRRSQSPNSQSQQYNNHRGGDGNNPNGRSRGHHGRWSSQSSLASEGSASTLERRHQQRSRNFARTAASGGGGGGVGGGGGPNAAGGAAGLDNWNEEYRPNEQLPPCKDNESNELVRNARQTTKYMNYLSSK